MNRYPESCRIDLQMGVRNSSKPLYIIFNRILQPNNPNGKAVLFKKKSKSIDFKTLTSFSSIYPEA